MTASSREHRHKRKRDRKATELNLVRAATKLFASRGYDRTTTRQIAAQAQAAEGLIHRYFGGKAGLLFAIINSHVSRETQELASDLPLESSLAAEIQHLTRRQVELMWQDRDLLRVSVPRAILDPEISKQIYSAGPQRHALAIAARLRRHAEGKKLRSDQVDAIANCIVVLGFIFGFMRPAVFGRTREEARVIARNIAAIVSNGISPLKAREPSQS